MNETPTQSPGDQGPEQPCTNHFSDGSKIFPNRDCCKGPERVAPDPTAEQARNNYPCESERHGSRIFYCSLDMGHDGAHVCIEGGMEVARWEKDDTSITDLRQRIAQLERENARRCEHCGSHHVIDFAPGCPFCGAPNCCQVCCKTSRLESELAQLRATIETLTRERDEARAEAENASDDLWLCAIARLWNVNFNKPWDDRDGESREEAISHNIAVIFQEIDSLRAQLAASEKDRQWQPIETAPRNGTKFLIWEIDFKAHRIAWWREHRGAFGDDCYQYNFTHWLPLRAAPTQSEAL